MSSSQDFDGQVSFFYLTKTAAVLAALKQRSYERLAVGKESRLLDLGCGPGGDVFALAGMIDPSGQITGFDNDIGMLKQASTAGAHDALKDRAAFIQGNAQDLPFQDNVFDGCRSERLFMHLDQPERTLAEMQRVTRPGGKIVVIDTDWLSLSIDTPFPATERALSEYRLARVLKNGYSGRSLYRQFKQCQLADVQVEVYPLCVTDLDLFYFLTMQEAIEEQALAAQWISAVQLEDWRREIRRAADAGCFYASANMVMISAVKPEFT
ncbi:methyltransferase domain-containing protein [Methylomicrobium sp. Wu6]|uniref:methyltransferase domain-containing protein n=1 Tax=Methylomicrobium sp. Wu6 TaxID=3107928 RepID=UPI002DD61F20|nr:methyltransferase domain-containing protein [Methylomicrobium sp. Wu6]MEC4747751.1 methyltransferase domain-containing protein [Methylomicrobium sp. Wu6]